MSPPRPAATPGTVADETVDRSALLRPGISLPVVGILLAEASIFLAQGSGRGTVVTALWVYVGVLGVTVLGPLRYPDDAGLFISFLLVPTFRIVNLGMPRLLPGELGHLLAVYALFVPATYALLDLRSVPTPQFGVRRGLVLAPAALVLGALLAPVEYAILAPDALASPGVPQLLSIAAVMLVVSYVEEFIFRGVILESVIDRVGRARGIILVSAVFAAMHSISGLAGELAFTFLVGVGLSYLYLRLESLTFVVVVHAAMNAVLFGILPHIVGRGLLPAG